MTDDDLRRVFEEAREDVVDAGFARRVVAKIERIQRRRRIVLGVAAGAGSVLAMPAVLRMHEFFVPLTWSPAHAAGQVVSVIALAAAAIAVWLFSLTAEG